MLHAVGGVKERSVKGVAGRGVGEESTDGAAHDVNVRSTILRIVHGSGIAPHGGHGFGRLINHEHRLSTATSGFQSKCA
jgi:hypothetical protein